MSGPVFEISKRTRPTSADVRTLILRCAPTASIVFWMRLRNT